MTRAKNILERVSDIVYHGTSVESAVAILRDDEFLLVDSRTTFRKRDREMPGPQPYYMCVTRGKGYADQYPVTFVLDGTKLSQRYSGHPVDYFGNFDEPDMEMNRKYRHMEMEDRIYSKSPTTPHFSQYIKEMHVLTPLHHTQLELLEEWSRERSIPVFLYRKSGSLYDAEPAYTLLDKKRSFGFNSDS